MLPLYMLALYFSVLLQRKVHGPTPQKISPWISSVRY